MKLVHYALLAYGTMVPEHRGKWWVIDKIVNLFGMERYYHGRWFTARRQGITWRLQPDCKLHRTLYLQGIYEPHETHWLKSVVQPGWTFFDIGSNCGYYSMLVHALSGPTSRVYAFEPLEENFALLNEHRALNRFEGIETFKLGLSDEVGELTFVLPPASNRGIGRMNIEGKKDGEEGVSERVPMTTLDRFVAEHGVERIDFMKIDVEGAEIKVLSGARGSIERFHPLMLIEINPGALAVFGTSGEELLRTIQEFGYDTFVTGRSGLVPFNDAGAIEDYVNVICIPHEGRAVA